MLVLCLDTKCPVCRAGTREVTFQASLHHDDADADAVGIEINAQMGRRRASVGDRENLFRGEKLHAVIATKIAVLVVVPIGIGLWIALVGVADHRGCLMSQTAV